MNQLAVECWKKRPDKFGLKEYRQLYPNNNIVGCCLWGRRGMIARGLVERCGTKFVPKFRVTQKGRQS